MAYKYYTVQEISKWYKENTEHSIPLALLSHMTDDGMITNIANKCFSLSEINNYLLEKENCNFVKDTNGKFIFKKNRQYIMDKYNAIKVDSSKKPKFKIINLQGNNFKLQKI